MCVPSFSSPPAAPLPPPTQPALPAQSDSAREARERERRRRRAAFGPAATLLTGGQGLSGQARSAAKTLLGE